MSDKYYTEVGPAFIEEESYHLLITLDGTADITGWTFSGKLTGPEGQQVPNAVTASVTDAPNRKVTAIIAGQNLKGRYRWSVRRVDDGSDFVTAWGTINILDPHGDQ